MPLALRLTSALVLAPFAGWVVWSGGPVFWGLMALAYLRSLYEWERLALKGETPVFDSLTGVVYLSICYMTFIVLCIFFPHGGFLGLAVMITVWSSDTLAYVAGKIFGGPKLAPALSPGKTWSGFGGALAGALLAVLAVYATYPYAAGYADPAAFYTAPDIFLVIAAGIFSGIIGQAGDLFISLYKRKIGVKDTGELIPGHGGILDRIDSLMLVSAYAFSALCCAYFVL